MKLTFVLRCQVTRGICIEAGERARIVRGQLGPQFARGGQSSDKVGPLQLAQRVFRFFTGVTIARVGRVGDFAFEHAICIKATSVKIR